MSSYSLITQFRRRIAQSKLDAYLVVHPPDIRYLTGVPAEDAWLLVLPRKTYYLTDARYTEHVRKQAPDGVVVKEICKSLPAETARILGRYSRLRTGVDGRHISLLLWKTLKKYCPRQSVLRDVSGCVQDLRRIKTEAEIAAIRESIRINQDLFRYLRRVIRPGKTEQEIKNRMADFVLRRGVSFSFDPIVASGPNSAYPHARVTGRRIRAADPVLVDAGIEKNGYKSDLTRIFLSDKIPHSIRAAYRAVAEAQQCAIAGIAAGRPVAEADQAARKSLRQNNLLRYCAHALGHGVGLEIHEPPRVSVKSRETFSAGMVVTVEPGIYRPGHYGIRVEDMVLVTGQGSQILSRGQDPEAPQVFRC
ncbi:MAG: M24 family metallopeptidase [Candidatus Omnitrophota bacterium]